MKTKRSERKFKLNKSLFWCSKHFVSTDYKHSLTGKGKDLLPTASPSRFQWTKVSSHEIKRAKQCKRREARLAIAYSVVVCSEDNGDPLQTSKVKTENEHQNEDFEGRDKTWGRPWPTGG